MFGFRRRHFGIGAGDRGGNHDHLSLHDVRFLMADGDAPDDWLFQLPGEIARYLTGEEPVQGNEDDHKIVKELYRIHPDAEWVWETLTSNVVRADKAEKYERDDYKQRTLRQAWAEIQAELDVFEVEEPQGEAEPVGRFSLNRAMRRLKAPFWIVQGMWRRGDLIALLGHPNAGKTAIGLDLCLRIALGLELMGRRVVKQRVFYISAENPEEVLLRVKAWCIAHNVSEAELEDTFKICPHRLDLSNPAIAKLIATELKKYEGLEFGVFAVDTFSSNFGGEDENAAAQVMLWINNLRDHIMTILKC